MINIIQRFIENRTERRRRLERDRETARDMQDLSIYESRKTRRLLSPERVDSLRQKYPDRIREFGVFDRAGDAMGDGPAFYILTALKVQYEKAQEIKNKYPTFSDFVTHLLDETDRRVVAGKINYDI